MKPARVIAVFAICVISAVAFLSSSWRLSAQNSEQDTQPEPAVTLPPTYNPYPPGILPSNLNTEFARVEREIQTVFNRYFAQWQR